MSDADISFGGNLDSQKPNSLEIKGPDGSTVFLDKIEFIEGDNVTINVDAIAKTVEISSSGGGGGNGGYIELSNEAAPLNIFDGPAVTFVKTDYGDEVDVIDDGLSLTRGENGAIYNPVSEMGWDSSSGDPYGRTSPRDTEWNAAGWATLTNLDQRTYYTFYDSVGGNFGNNVLTPNFIMRDNTTGNYYKIDFTVWGNASIGAPVTYTRQQVDPTTGDDIGSLVTFTKVGYADPFANYDAVSANVHISRGNYSAIFNIVSETGYNNNNQGDLDPYGNPDGTEWNLDGWSDLTNVESRTYFPFLEIIDEAVGMKIVNLEWILHDTINDNYYTVKFHNWTGLALGGGFSYTRRKINLNCVFSHSENGDEIDEIVPGVIAITRDYNYAIYNPYDEGSWNNEYSPGGTEWNFDGNLDLSNVETRIYKTFYEANQFWGIGRKIDGAEAVMRVPSTGKYYTIKFLYWQQGGGGAFKYVRTEIDLDKVNEGIKFADGTVQKTAANSLVKFKGAIHRRIEEWYGFKNIKTTNAQLYTMNTTVRSYGTSNSFAIDMPSYELMQEFGNHDIKNVYISFDGGLIYHRIKSNGYGTSGGYYNNFYTVYDNEVTWTNNQNVTLKYYRFDSPVLWFDPTESPGGSGNFRGAIVEYHAYSNSYGNLIGRIITSNDNGNFNITHEESGSGDYDLTGVSFWHSESEDQVNEGQLFVKANDQDIFKIQFKATMFYGSETYD